MYLKRLQVTNFKNYEDLSLDLDRGIISLTGKNGVGKTNLLDAIYYLSFTKSAISASDTNNVRFGESFFLIKGTIDRLDKENILQCSYQQNAKKNFLINKNPLTKLSDHIGEFPVVLVAPNDTDLVREWSDLRRKFFDGLISQINRRYLEELISYNHFLKQRNSLLKSHGSHEIDKDLLDQYDFELIRSGSILWESRRDFVEKFKPYFNKKYQQLADEESVSINYVSDYDRGDPKKLMEANRRKDMLMQRTTFGIHRDDYDFLLADRPMKKTGSQGQQKSFVIALRLAQFEVIREEKGFAPILLLDDIFDKLDDSRIKRMTSIIDQETFGQIFITDARPERTLNLIDQIEKKVMIFEVDKGQLEPMKA